MSSELSVGSNGAEEFSALIDGELGPGGVARACASWRSDPRSRETWHAYHLIGDVLRCIGVPLVEARPAAIARPGVAVVGVSVLSDLLDGDPMA